MFIVFISLAFISLFVSRRKYGTIYSPLGVFGFLWNIYLFLFEIRLINYFTLSVNTYIVLIGSYMLFVVGVLISPVFDTHFLPLMKFNGKSRESDFIDNFNLQKMRNVLMFSNAMAFVGVILMLVNLSYFVGLGNILDMNMVRTTMRGLSPGERLMAGWVGYLPSLLPLNAVLGGIYLTYVPKGRFHIFFGLFIALALSIVSGNRAIFIITIVLFIVSYIIAQILTKGVGASKIFKPILLSIAVLTIVFVIIGKIRFDPGNSSLDMFARYNITWSLLHPYSYVTAGIGALNIRLDYPAQIHLPGLHTFSAVIRLVARLMPSLIGYDYETIVIYSVKTEFVATPLRINIYTYLGALFNDFGWGGVLVGPFLMGLSSGLVFRQLLRKPSFITIGLYAFFCLQVVYSSVAMITHANIILVSIFFRLLWRICG